MCANVHALHQLYVVPDCTRKIPLIRRVPLYSYSLSCMLVIIRNVRPGKRPKPVEMGTKTRSMPMHHGISRPVVDQIVLFPRCFNAKANSSNLAGEEARPARQPAVNLSLVASRIAPCSLLQCNQEHVQYCQFPFWCSCVVRIRSHIPHTVTGRLHHPLLARSSTRSS
jgi:hypothetical protein